MKNLRSTQDVEEWLEPMSYLEFWYAIEPFELRLQGQDKAHCDKQIRNTEVDQETVLDVLKYFARLELSKRYQLKRRVIAPWLEVVQ